ncbi:MAG: fibronectin type III domain-containing protein [Chloroflexota bacterium]
MRRPTSLPALLGLLAAAMLAVPGLVLAQTAEDPSNVVLVFDVSDSILQAKDGTNTEFAAALNGIADRVKGSAEELAIGNAEISFVAFGRTAISYPSGCEKLRLHADLAAVDKLEACLRSIAAQYQAGTNATVRKAIDTASTDHVAALRKAASLLPSLTTRSAVIFFTDGEHDPPGTSRDNENVVNAVKAAFAGRSPLAILPVGLGSGAGAFKTDLQALYDAYLRDMEPCEGRTTFAWPEVVFPAADVAGVAVAQALQEVTCSFTFVPEPSPTPSPSPSPTPPAAGGPVSVQLLAGDESITVQWQAPASGADQVTGYAIRCRPQAGGDWVESTGGATDVETVVEGLTPGIAYTCEVAAVTVAGTGEYTASAETIVVLGIPTAPGQPRVEPMDGGARVSVDPVAGGAPAEQYRVECANASGLAGTGAASAPSVIVTGLRNGDTVTCVAFAENRIGRSAASVASAAFSPCAGLDCSPPLKYGLLGGAVLAALAVAAFVARRYARRNRVWITAQVDGGENRPLGWGPELGIELERDDDGWFAAPRPAPGSKLQVRYAGRQRFAVGVGSSIRDVHQGDPTSVRDAEGTVHQLILRKYGARPREATRTAAATPADPKAAAELGTRLDGKGDDPPPSEAPPSEAPPAAAAASEAPPAEAPAPEAPPAEAPADPPREDSVG